MKNLKYRNPVVYSASEIATWHVSEEFKPGHWRPARPCGFRAEFMYRLRVAWFVFIGRYDALNWRRVWPMEQRGSELQGYSRPGICSGRKVSTIAWRASMKTKEQWKVEAHLLAPKGWMPLPKA